MKLNDLVDAITSYTDGVVVDGPWPTPTGWQITVGDRFGDGRTVTVTDDGIARWVPQGLPQRVCSKPLPRNVELAAEIIAGLIYR